MLYVKLEVGIGQKFVNRLIGHFFSTINRLIVENMLHNANGMPSEIPKVKIPTGSKSRQTEIPTGKS